MRTQVEFYDKDVIKNTLGVLTMKPDKVVYIYDKELTDMNRFLSIEKCLKKHLPNIIVERYPVDALDMGDVYKTTSMVIDKSGDACVIDITGGSELMVIGGYRAGVEKEAQIIHTDIIKEEVIDIVTGAMLAKTAMLTLEDFVDAHGALFIGTSHDHPEYSEFDTMLNMCGYLFKHLNKWKSTCNFFQVAMSESSPRELDLRIHKEIQQKDGRKVSPDEDMLYEFQRNGFIRDLYVSDKHVVLSFTSVRNKAYMISYGVWLELYVYIHAIKETAFSDVKLGTMIDWDAYNGITVAGNEIDVILQDRSMPVFISCKLRAADTAALNELLIAKKRLGGWFSKCIIVSFGDDKAMKNGTYKRAKELGIEMLDKTDILSKDFGKKLIEAVRGQDLISLKWKKI